MPMHLLGSCKGDGGNVGSSKKSCRLLYGVRVFSKSKIVNKGKTVEQ
jgi:hypothetical protein